MTGVGVRYVCGEEGGMVGFDEEEGFGGGPELGVSLELALLSNSMLSFTYFLFSVSEYN